MKQNERLLVYAVTGFLALILVVALVFSPETGKNPLKSGTGAQGLDEIILGKKAGAAEPKKEADAQTAAVAPAAPEKPPEGIAGLPTPKEVTPTQPLNAVAKPLQAADLVLQTLGPSRVEHGVRFVRAQKNDSLEGLVKRWCGARDPFLAEARALNEDLQVLRAGQEVALPVVSDDTLVAAIEAQKPKTLVPAPSESPVASTAGAMDALMAGTGVGKAKPADAVAANTGKPDFAQPGSNPSVVTKGAAPKGPEAGRSPAASVGSSYTVKEKDSLWGIASKTYGKKNADKMIPRIKDANPGLGESLQPGQKLVLPPAETPSKAGA